jgi:omega-3 fatty acid desaturase (delta-15 desaturase)
MPPSVGKDEISKEASAAVPPFTMDSLRKQLEAAGCFAISEATAIYYMLRDFAILGALYWLYPYCSNWALHVLWWNVVGFFGWSLFVVGHDCGHRTFSRSLLVNDVLGHVCHTPLLVPFHSWRISHYHHHMNHNHVEKDHSWKPVKWHRYSQWDELTKFVRFTPLVAFLYPWYLISDNEMASGNHFNPWSRLFAPEERQGACISVACVVGWLSLLLWNVPLWTLLDAYVVPYIIFTYWLSMVTYLHHTDSRVPYYRDGEWSFLKGALSTIDRSYGSSAVDHLMHDIGTHTVHHIFFTKIPHYNLRKATALLKPVLGEFFVEDNTFFALAFWRSSRECHYVNDEGTIVKYQPHSFQPSAKTPSHLRPQPSTVNDQLPGKPYKR